MSQRIDVAEIIGKQPFGQFHVRIIVLFLAIQFLDGFDTQALAYAAPALRDAWGLGPRDLGPVFSWGAIGSGIGSICMGLMADMFGRKKIMIASVALFGVLSLCTVLVTSIEQLLILRPLTGFGLGAALPLTFVMANEFAPPRMRARMIAAMACGFAIGAASGGLLQAEMVPYFGWQGIFFIGGVVPLLLAVALIFLLPESVRYLAARGGRSDEIARILKKIDPKLSFPPGTEFVLRPPPEAAHASRYAASTSPQGGGGIEVRREGKTARSNVAKPLQLFAGGLATTTVLLWFTYFMTLASMNTLNNWLPVALNTAGLEQQQALRVTTLFQFGGIAGVLLLGVLADRFGYPRVLIAAFLGLALFVAATGSVGADPWLLAAAVAGTGFCLVGANNTLSAFATTLYPTEVRATGVSWASSFGRLIGAIGPYVGGILLATMALQPVFFIFAVPALCAAIGVLLLAYSRRGGEPVGGARAAAKA
jgi:AAHS family 4-hydroxybenzoate transporter-like MFS transporter